MRTTLTIDPDVAALLKRVLKETETSLKQAVNEALRRGLRDFQKSDRPGRRFKVKPFKGTRLLIDVTSTSRALAQAEGEWYK